jgi:signal transduction histidine kinase
VNQLCHLASELALAEQREQRGLSQVLHDRLQQILVASKYRVSPINASKVIRQTVAEISDLIDEAIEASRSLTAELSPPIQRDEGLVPAIGWLAWWMHDRHGLNVTLIVHEGSARLPEEINVLVFHATRELLFNVVKHAFVKRANVEIYGVGDQIQVTVQDEGVGFDPDQVLCEKDFSTGFGLFSIRERFSLLGGRLEIKSSPGQGSEFKLVAPMNQASETAPAFVEKSLPNSNLDLSAQQSTRDQ